MRNAERKGEPGGAGESGGCQDPRLKREAVKLWGSGVTNYNRVDPKFWLAAPIRHLVFGCEFRRPNR